MNSRIQKQEQPICSPKIILPNPNKKSDVIARSEEVQAIIDRMPTYWAKGDTMRRGTDGSDHITWFFDTVSRYGRRTNISNRKCSTGTFGR